MKKFFVIVMCVLSVSVMTSCSDGKCDECRNVTEYSYNGHDYIRFENGAGGGRTWSVVHNPDCNNPKCN